MCFFCNANVCSVILWSRFIRMHLELEWSLFWNFPATSPEINIYDILVSNMLTWSVWLLAPPLWVCRTTFIREEEEKKQKKEAWRWGWGWSRAVQAGCTCLTQCHGYPRCVCHSAPTRIDWDGDTQTQALPRTLVCLSKHHSFLIRTCRQKHTNEGQESIEDSWKSLILPKYSRLHFCLQISELFSTVAWWERSICGVAVMMNTIHRCNQLRLQPNEVCVCGILLVALEPERLQGCASDPCLMSLFGLQINKVWSGPLKIRSHPWVCLSTVWSTRWIRALHLKDSHLVSACLLISRFQSLVRCDLSQK